MPVIRPQITFFIKWGAEKDSCTFKSRQLAIEVRVLKTHHLVIPSALSLLFDLLGSICLRFFYVLIIIGINIMNLYECIVISQHSAQCLACTMSFNPHNSLVKRVLLFCCTDEDTAAKWGWIRGRVTQLGCCRAGTLTLGFLLPQMYSLT